MLKTYMALADYESGLMQTCQQTTLQGHDLDLDSLPDCSKVLDRWHSVFFHVWNFATACWEWFEAYHMMLC